MGGYDGIVAGDLPLYYHNFHLIICTTPCGYIFDF